MIDNVLFQIDSEYYYYHNNYPELSCEEAYEKYNKNELEDEPICEFCYDCFNEDLEELFNYLNKNLKISNLLLMTGSAGLWTGNHFYEPKLLTIKEFEEKRCKNCDELSYTLYNDLTLEVKCSHHDGTNCYYLEPIEKMNKEELKDILINMFNVSKKDNEWFKETYNKTLSKLNKSDLIDAIEYFNYIYN